MKLKKHKNSSIRIKTSLLLLAIAGAMAFVSQAKAQSLGDGILYSQNYLPWPPYIGDWQSAGVFNGVECKRYRLVENGGCSDWVPDGSPEGRFANSSDFCFYMDHGIADFQEGIYVPGTGCTQWTATSYTWVSGDGSQTGQLIDATSN